MAVGAAYTGIAAFTSAGMLTLVLVSMRVANCALTILAKLKWSQNWPSCIFTILP